MIAAQPAILPDHILSAVLALAQRQLVKSDPKKMRLAFRGHDFQLQEIFNDLRRTGKYSILNPFVFSDSGPEPYCPVLTESVSRLQLSGLIGRENPDYQVVFLRPAADQFFSEVLSTEFDADQIQQLTEIASQFLNKVRTV